MRNKSTPEFLSVETDYHIVEIEKKSFAELKKFCKNNQITMDYFFFEFQEFAKWSILFLVL